MKKKCKCNSLMLLRMQRFGMIAVSIIIGMVIVLSSSCKAGGGKKQSQDSTIAVVYYCPMHPDVQQDHPGVCPKPECNGMKLVLKNPDDLLKAVLQPVSTSVLSQVNIINPVFKSMPIFTEATGYINYDNYSTWDVSSRYSGRIEKLFVKYNYQPVKKGEILFEVYSPDLITAQENLIYILKNSADDVGLLNAARQKLVLLQLTNEQIHQIESSGKIMHSIPVYSKYEGHIHELSDSNMPTGDLQKNPILGIREGMYIESGQALFNIVNPTKMIALLQIKSADIGKVKLKQKVSYYINGDSSMIMNGTIGFIEPMFNSNSKTLIARVDVKESEHMHKTGSLVDAKIYSDSLQTLWIPVTAVVDLGKNKIVWVSDDGFFKAKKVETGLLVGGMIEIADGLTEADKVAVEGHFLSDSESFIKLKSDE